MGADKVCSKAVKRKMNPMPLVSDPGRKLWSNPLPVLLISTKATLEARKFILATKCCKFQANC